MYNSTVYLVLLFLFYPAILQCLYVCVVCSTTGHRGSIIKKSWGNENFYLNWHVNVYFKFIYILKENSNFYLNLHVYVYFNFIYILKENSNFYHNWHVYVYFNFIYIFKANSSFFQWKSTSNVWLTTLIDIR